DVEGALSDDLGEVRGRTLLDLQVNANITHHLLHGAGARTGVWVIAQQHVIQGQGLAVLFTHTVSAISPACLIKQRLRLLYIELHQLTKDILVAILGLEQGERAWKFFFIANAVEADGSELCTVNTSHDCLTDLEVAQVWGFTVQGDQDVGRAHRSTDFNAIHVFNGCQTVLGSNTGCINFASLEGVDGSLRFHLTEGHAVQQWFVAPPVLIWNEGNRTGVEVHVVHLVWTRAPLWVQLIDVRSEEHLSRINLGWQQEAKQTLPPSVFLLEGDHCLLLILALFNGLNEFVAIGGRDIEFFIFTVVELPGVLK